jgi:hypothetical protein
MKIYIERKIESEKDLPKEQGVYFVIGKNIKKELMFYDPNCKGKTLEYDISYWLEFCDSWLEPIEVDKGAGEILSKHKIADFDDAIQAMQEYAAIQVAKALDKPTDEEIKEYLLKKYPYEYIEDYDDPIDVNNEFRKCVFEEIKAALDGKIKKEK